jgi:hypothetical protein
MLVEVVYQVSNLLLWQPLLLRLQCYMDWEVEVRVYQGEPWGHFLCRSSLVMEAVVVVAVRQLGGNLEAHGREHRIGFCNKSSLNWVSAPHPRL